MRSLYSNRMPQPDRTGKTVQAKIELSYIAEGLPPSRVDDEDAGYDLRAAQSTVVASQGRALIKTGLRVAIPTGYAGLVLPRSGIAWHHGITIANSPGLVDSGFRGELLLAIINTHPTEDFAVEIGDRLAQLVIVAVPAVKWKIVEQLPKSRRGDSGYGSSGINDVAPRA